MGSTHNTDLKNRLWTLPLFTVFEENTTWNYNYTSVALVGCTIMTLK